MITCPECGQQLPDGTRFCTSCGQACNRTARRVQQRNQMDAAQTMPASWDGTPRTSAQSAQAYDAQDSRAAYSSQQTQFIPPQERPYADRNAQVGYAQTPLVSQPSTGRTAEAFVPAYAPGAAQQASAAAAASGGTAQQAKSRRTAIIAAVIAAVLIVVVVAVAAWTSRANSEAQYNAEHADRHVTFALDMPGYDKKSDSPVPVRISGTNLDGVQVDEVRFITPDEPTISLQQGSYTVSVAASPLLSNGTMYAVPTDLIDVQVREQDLSGGDLNWTFTAVEPKDITDEQIEQSYQYAIESGMDATAADALRQGVIDARQAALDKQAAEDQAAADRAAAEAEQRAQEEAAASARHFDDGCVALDVPDFWVGNYTSATYDHTSGVFHTEFYLPNSNFMLLRIDGMDGDLSTYGATYMNSATEIWNSTHGGSDYSDADLDWALYLQTGGAITRDDVLACGSGTSAEALGEQYIGSFMDNNISPTVTTSQY